MKRMTIAVLLTLLAMAAAYRPLQAGRARIVRTVAASLIRPVIAAQSADVAGTRSDRPAEAAVAMPCPKSGSRSAVVLLKAEAKACELGPHA